LHEEIAVTDMLHDVLGGVTFAYTAEDRQGFVLRSRAEEFEHMLQRGALVLQGLVFPLESLGVRLLGLRLEATSGTATDAG
jgi:hypothetical protein